MTHQHSNQLLIKRIREMPMNPADIARAEADFRRASVMVDAVFDLAAALRTGGTRIARQLRSVFVPQH